MLRSFGDRSRPVSCSAAFTVGSDKRGSACELELAMYVQEVLVVGLQSALDNRAGVMSVVDKLDAVFSLSQPIELHERVIPDQVSLWRDFTRNFQVQLVRWLVLQVCEMPGLLRDAVEVSQQISGDVRGARHIARMLTILRSCADPLSVT